MNAQEGNLSPSLTPWGSRSPSPHPSADTNEDTPEVLSGADMEVLHVTSGFRPIPCMDKDVHTPWDSPTEGILPVGGVVKGHSLPGAKNEPLARVCLKKDLTTSQRYDALKAFVVIEPKSEKGPDGNLCSAKENVPAMGPEGRRDLYLSGDEKPSGSKMDDAKEPSGANMDGAKEPSGSNMDSAKEPCDVKMDGAKGHSGDKMEDEESKAFSSNNIERRNEPPKGSLKRENKGSMKEIKNTSWYIVEGTDGDGKEAKEPSTNKGEQTTSQQKFTTSGDKGTEVTIAGKHFTLGHRRVASSPPAITVSSVETEPLSGGTVASSVTCLERSRSDSDISTLVKHDLDESVVSGLVFL